MIPLIEKYRSKLADRFTMEEYRPNIADRLTLTDYVNLEAIQRKVEPSELWKKVQTTPIVVEELHFAVAISRHKAIKSFNKTSAEYDAVVNVVENAESTLLNIWNYYIIRGLGVNFKDQ